MSWVAVLVGTWVDTAVYPVETAVRPPTGTVVVVVVLLEADMDRAPVRNTAAAWSCRKAAWLKNNKLVVTSSR